MSNHEERQLIGVDLGNASVKLAVLSIGSGWKRLEAAALAPVGPERTADDYETALSSVLEAAEGFGRRVATSVSGPHVAVRTLHFPRLGAEEIEGAVWYEGGQVIAFDIDDSLVDYDVLDADEGKEKTNVLFVAATKEEVAKRTSILEACGLEPRVVGVDGLVLLEALLSSADLPPTTGILDIGARYSCLGVSRCGTVPFVRDIDIAGDTFTQAISDALGVTVAEAEEIKIAGDWTDARVSNAVHSATRWLVAEINRSLVYYQTREDGSKVDRLFLCGGGSRIRGLRESISESIGIEVDEWDSLRGITVDEARFDSGLIESIRDFMPLAVALAMKSDPK